MEQHYDIYVDESFFRFWGFDDPDGNFCYAAVGVPGSQRVSFKQGMVALFGEFQLAAEQSLLEVSPPEIKSTIFRRMPLPVRRRFAFKIRDLLLKTNSFFLSEYSPVRGFVIESIRSDLVAQGQEELPSDITGLYNRRRQELVNSVRREGAGQSPILRNLIALPSSALAHYLARRTESFTVILDPRGRVEDAEIARSIAAHSIAVLEAVQHENADKFREVISDKTSIEVPELQIADLLAGEVRNWFILNPEFLQYKSGTTLLPASKLGDMFPLKTREGTAAKPERHTRMPYGLVRRLTTATEGSTLPYFRGSLANHLLSCIAEHGEFRHIDFSRHLIIDSPDDN